METLLMAIPFAAAIAVVAVLWIYRKPRHVDAADTGDDADAQDAGGRALPINKCQMARVRHVIDGDTLVATTATQEINIRLSAIDCPENGQHWGDIATLELMNLVGGRKIAFEGHATDRFGRTIATVYVRDVDNDEWTDVNARMIVRGHAWVTRRDYKYLPKSRKAELNRLERWAQRKRAGLWKSDVRVPPWQWRAGNF